MECSSTPLDGPGHGEKSVNHSLHFGDDDDFDPARPWTLTFNIHGARIHGSRVEHGAGGLDALVLVVGVDVLVSTVGWGIWTISRVE